METPRVLVVLPTLGKRPEFFEKALQSCRDLSNRIPISIVVVAPGDDASTRKVCESRGAIVVDDPGTGMADAINRALSIATTEEFYVWLGDDDELVVDGVARLVEALSQAPEAVVAYGHCDYVDNKGRKLVTSRGGTMARWMLAFGPNLIPHPGTVIRLSALRAIGGFHPRLSYALDLDVFLRLRSLGHFISLPVVASRFRWHEDSLTVADRAASTREAIAVKNRHLPSLLRPFAWMWNYPVAGLSYLAARRVSALARRLEP